MTETLNCDGRGENDKTTAESPPSPHPQYQQHQQQQQQQGKCPRGGSMSLWSSARSFSAALSHTTGIRSIALKAMPPEVRQQLGASQTAAGVAFNTRVSSNTAKAITTMNSDGLQTARSTSSSRGVAAAPGGAGADPSICEFPPLLLGALQATEEEVEAGEASKDPVDDASTAPGEVRVLVRVRPLASKRGAMTCCKVLAEKNVVEHVLFPNGMQNRAQASLTSKHSFLSIEEASGWRTPRSQRLEQIGQRSTFTFDTVLGEKTTQSDTMARVGKPMLGCVLKGYNATILCYGQSGSGKTHTLLGPGGGAPKQLRNRNEVGLLPRMLEQLFVDLQTKLTDTEVGDNVQGTPGEAQLKHRQQQQGVNWQVELSSLELYNEELLDLLSGCPSSQPAHHSTFSLETPGASGTHLTPVRSSWERESSFESSVSQKRVEKSPSVAPAHSNARSRRFHRRGVSSLSAAEAAASVEKVQGLKIREDPVGGVFVEGLSWCSVHSYEEAMCIVLHVVQQRRVASTTLNDKSSRSHFLFFVAVQWWNGVGGAEGLEVPQGGELPRKGWKRSLLTLVDLAGSERVAATGAEGLKLREAQSINLSLTLLGNVIHRLTERRKEGGRTPHIPYRDSKLTRLLKESIGGNAVTTLLCTISPDKRNAAESLSTLRFAQRGKLIRNRPVINHVVSRMELAARLRDANTRIGLLEMAIYKKDQQLQLLMDRDDGGRSPIPSCMSTPCLRPSAGGGGNALESEQNTQQTDTPAHGEDARWLTEELLMYKKYLSREREEHARTQAMLHQERRRLQEMEAMSNYRAPSASGRVPTPRIDKMNSAMASTTSTSDDSARLSKGRHMHVSRQTTDGWVWRCYVVHAPPRNSFLYDIPRRLLFWIASFLPRETSSEAESGRTAVRFGEQLLSAATYFSGQASRYRTAAVSGDSTTEKNGVAGRHASPHVPAASPVDKLQLVKLLMRHGVSDTIQM
ncbi:putative MCAK-like kinesin [Trypanosoma grayi]|uniref:putative MCAK-like kinesin n=1 Tax=Trypanosoma grayi TaxID=71804 RepID=UPI0004F4AFFB|nr:putative MCAK-like kinesin [Trypanosoma grayi]KEG08955.1 putative MCAK-like kinesin [Trypanosoma grayi]